MSGVFLSPAQPRKRSCGELRSPKAEQGLFVSPNKGNPKKQVKMGSSKSPALSDQTNRVSEFREVISDQQPKRSQTKSRGIRSADTSPADGKASLLRRLFHTVAANHDVARDVQKKLNPAYWLRPGTLARESHGKSTPSKKAMQQAIRVVRSLNTEMLPAEQRRKQRDNLMGNLSPKSYISTDKLAMKAVELMIEEMKVPFKDAEKPRSRQDLQNKVQGRLGELYFSQMLKSEGLEYIDVNTLKSNFGGIDFIVKQKDGSIQFYQVKVHMGEKPEESYRRDLADIHIFAATAEPDIIKHKDKLADFLPVHAYDDLVNYVNDRLEIVGLTGDEKIFFKEMGIDTQGMRNMIEAAFGFKESPWFGVLKEVL